MSRTSDPAKIPKMEPAPRKRTLPLGEPTVDAYNNLANITSILSYYERITPWIQGQFIQLYWDTDRSYLSFYIPYIKSLTPWIIPQSISRNMINKGWGGDIIRFITDAVDQGQYVTVFVDKYYIPGSEAYLNYQFPHELFVYGYDLFTETLEVADHMQDSKYVRFQCPFDRFEEGYRNLYLEDETYNNNNGMVSLVSFNLKKEALPFNWSQTFAYLEDYLFSRDSAARELYSKLQGDKNPNMERYWGGEPY